MMTISAFKYQGAGNDFIILDNYNGDLEISLDQIRQLCDRKFGIGADGLMIFGRDEKYDFSMKYYNSDGSTGMMCGNGGRCIISFAASKGITPSGKTAEGQEYVFEAPDGIHRGSILRTETPQTTIVRLKMNDVSGITLSSEGHYLMNTGCDHLVVFCNDAAHAKVLQEGRRLRFDPEFYPRGVNVNFVEVRPSHIIVRTYEKGVEDETLSCGTGVIASAIAAHLATQPAKKGQISFDIRTTRHNLRVEFVPENGTDLLQTAIKDVHIIGPAEYVFKAEITL